MVNMVNMRTSYRCHLQPCSHYHLELSCKKWRRPSWGSKAELEREWKKARSMAWHGIRARTNGPEDRVSPVWVETHPFEGLVKGHHPNSFFAPICCCSWAHHLYLSLSLTTKLFCSHTFHFTVSVSTSTVWSSLFFHSLGYTSVSAFCLSETRLLWEGKEGERGVSCHEKLWGQLLRERKKGSMRWGRGRKKRVYWVVLCLLQNSRFYPFFLSLFFSATKILSSPGAKSARVGDLGFFFCFWLYFCTFTTCQGEGIITFAWDFHPLSNPPPKLNNLVSLCSFF